MEKKPRLCTASLDQVTVEKEVYPIVREWATRQERARWSMDFVAYGLCLGTGLSATANYQRFILFLLFKNFFFLRFIFVSGMFLKSAILERIKMNLHATTVTVTLSVVVRAGTSGLL